MQKSVSMSLADPFDRLNQAPDVALVPPPTQVWAVKGHVHHLGPKKTPVGNLNRDDIAVLARDEADARVRLVALLRMGHHDCRCETCKTAIAGKFPDHVALVRIK